MAYVLRNYCALFVVSIAWMGLRGAHAQTAPTTAPYASMLPEMKTQWGGSIDDAAFRALSDHERRAFRLADIHSRDVNQALFRCRLFVEGWLAKSDPVSGLIPRNFRGDRFMGAPSGDIWNGRDCAADNYAFMVLTASITDQDLLNGRMLDMLNTEQRLTNRIGRLMDNYQFSKRGFIKDKPVLDEIIFDNAEYVKDGLIPITEWLGHSPWSQRMIGIMEDIWANAAVETPFGKIPTKNFEVNGDLLQACSRLYWFTGEKKWLEWGTRIGDYYLLGENHPTRHMSRLLLGDHSCEVINGLSELYLACRYAMPEKREAYRAPLHEMYDRILEVGVNEHGMMHLVVNPQSGEILRSELTDNWGYNYDGFYTVYMVDGVERYYDAVRKALASLKPHMTGFRWQRGSADGYADSIEGAITLINRLPDDSAAEWVDTEIRVMWAKQRPDGIIEGWHGDGNFARTSLMYALWKSQGTTVAPWRPDVRVGAVRDGDALRLVVACGSEPWRGKLRFDRPRHRDVLKLPIDYPRINQFPEWFVVEADQRYTLEGLSRGETRTDPGQALIDGIALDLPANGRLMLTIRPAQ